MMSRKNFFQNGCWAKRECRLLRSTIVARDAESAGKAAVDAAKSRADSELKVLREKAEKQTAEKTAALDNEMLAEADRLRHAAELKLEDAAALVVERIVGS